MLFPIYLKQPVHRSPACLHISTHVYYVACFMAFNKSCICLSQAYKKVADDSKSLPGLSDYTNDQLFFIAFAQVVYTGVFINPRRACTRVMVLGLCVCPAPRVLPLRATEHPTEGTYGFGTIWETF